jgi:hypothetical protein
LRGRGEAQKLNRVPESLNDMRYWAYLAAKVLATCAVFGGLIALLNYWWPPERQFLTYVPPRFGYSLGYTFATLILFLLFDAALYFVWWDQRYRCRVCLRRLRMPVETGSWSRMLQFGRPRIEYICPYGHGTLKQDELQILGRENAEWTPHSDDIWEELVASSKEPDEQP